ncbi:ABC transporter ATP-binding protein [Paenibacillus arenilitoris]|uniref:ABC transporter ATP-binding protein n=1 Tax=Paenibacillus arenilitoris TaxID=2772299 RepID=A0A927CQA7_9BACL|nr:ABC transporter ATP-binding protein [Paenibacillus arenilitoris]MBD2871779.1 ABC transporter ATP-binding protein [Paenibacillus arenilitoris]
MVIEADQLFFAYPGTKKRILHGLSFSIGPGEIFGFLGPSGAGKSTTQKILIGALKSYEGRVQVLGEEIRNSRSDYYERIGVAFEFPNFYAKLTALENLKLFRSLYAGETEDPMRLLERVGLGDAAHAKVSELSKGMKMRLNFCRALLHRPPVLFLDEPTSGLDPVNARIMKELMLERRAEGTTIVITTHNMQAAEELCDRVAFIVDGRIKLIDSPRELRLRQGKKRVRVEYMDGEQRHTEEFAIDGLHRNERFLALLARFEVETIHSLEASLEQIFIDVTGRTLA